MVKLNAKDYDTRSLNAKIRQAGNCVSIENCLGERYIGCGLDDKDITIYGTPGNALGAYMNGANIQVYGNAQDAIGDTMNEGCITIHGNVQDACGYAMRGGAILIKGNAGYRCGIHMKTYQEKKPLIVIGNKAGSFLGEYLAGGTIIVLGLEEDDFPVGNFIGNGMYDGEIYIRTKTIDTQKTSKLQVEKLSKENLRNILPALIMYSDAFTVSLDTITSLPFYRLTSPAANPYQLHYIEN